MTNGWNPPGGQQPGQQPGPMPGQQPQAPQWGQQPQAPQPQPQGGYPPPPANFGAPQAPAQGGFAPPSFPSVPSAAQASNLAKGFFGSLIDFKFHSYITPRILGVLYGLILLMGVLGIPFTIYNAVIRPLMDDYEFTEPEFLPAILSPIAAILFVTFGRVMLETVAVRFRNTEQLDELIRKTKE